jgi:hypothetical protein
MKFSLFSVLFTILIILLFLTIFASCTQVVPYSRENIFTNNMFPYEGFTEYTTVQNNNSIDSYTQYDISPTKDNKYMATNGLLSSPDAATNPVDIYSQSAGEPSCKSYGYSNSRGFLCMNDDQVRLLTTRGGNASGGDMQIGGIASK